MTDAEEPVTEPVPEPAAPAAKPRNRWPIATALAVVLAIVFAVLWMSGGSDDTGDAISDIEDVAARFGEAYLSYDYDDVDASGDAVIALATDGFAEGFRSTKAPGIEQLFADLETSTLATTKEVFVGSVREERARALVVVDVAASSTASGNQDLTNLSFVLDLVKEDGEWRVDRVTPSPQPDIGDAPTDAPTEGSTTSAPVDSSATSAP